MTARPRNKGNDWGVPHKGWTSVDFDDLELISDSELAGAIITVQADPRMIQKMRVFSKKMPPAMIPPEMFQTRNLKKPSTSRTSSG